ncbi:MAG: type II toxin-antitoxin system RelE/ParE family toxin [Anaerolineales bacterium]|nr:type II toxin-antitoxin system RelE/ParE family toxin [Anaerolineales bacterium]
MQYQVIIHRKAEKILKRLDGDLRERVRTAIRELADEPRPMGVKKLAGYENLFRIRVGDWRIIYAVENDTLIVLVLEISTRGGAYRDF